jgi:hypothetical protein
MLVLYTRVSFVPKDTKVFSLDAENVPVLLSRDQVEENLGVSVVAGLRYNIYSGTHQQNARWIETVEGLATAVERMHKQAIKSPGPYIIFCPRDRTILATIDTTKRGMRGQELRR